MLRITSFACLMFFVGATSFAQDGSGSPPTFSQLGRTDDGQLVLQELRSEERTRVERVPREIIEDGRRVTVYEEVERTYAVQVPVMVPIESRSVRFYHADGDVLDYRDLLREIERPTPVVVADEIPGRRWLRLLNPHTIVVVRPAVRPRRRGGDEPRIGGRRGMDQRVFELVVPGTDVHSIAELVGDTLKITHQGEVNVYKRERDRDTENYLAYFSGRLSQAIGWPKDNQGSLEIGSVSPNGDVDFRESLMKIARLRTTPPVPDRPRGGGKLDGLYRIQVVADGRFLHEDGLGDRQLSTRKQVEDDYTRFYLEGQRDGSYRIRVRGSDRFWFVTPDSNGVVTTNRRDDGEFTRFKLISRGKDAYQIVCLSTRMHLHEDGARGGDRLLSTRHQTDDDYTLFRLKPVNPSYVESLSKLTPRSFVGTYRHKPTENDYHIGEIALSPSRRRDAPPELRWVNRSDVSWRLLFEPGSSQLATGNDNPYFDSDPETGRAFKIILRKVGRDRYVPEVDAFEFLGQTYQRVD